MSSAPSSSSNPALTSPLSSVGVSTSSHPMTTTTGDGGASSVGTDTTSHQGNNSTNNIKGTAIPQVGGVTPLPPTTTTGCGTQGYLYLDSLVLVTLLQLCTTADTSCQAAIRQLISTRESSPYAAQYWSDPSSGRVLPPTNP